MQLHLQGQFNLVQTGQSLSQALLLGLTIGCMELVTIMSGGHSDKRTSSKDNDTSL